MPSRRQQIGAVGALESWARTPDRTARTRNAREAGPASLQWHLDRLDPERFAEATEAQRLAAAQASRKAHYARLALASAKARAARKPKGGRRGAAGS